MYVSVVRAGGHLTPFIKKTTEVINDVDANSRYADLMRQIKIKAQSILMKTNNDPSDVAKVIYKALTARNPKNIYNVNISALFKFLTLLPGGFREWMMVRKLKKWM